MKLHQLERASRYDVQKWLENNLRNLTPDQIYWLRTEDIVTYSPFYFYQQSKKNKTSVFWRLSLPFFLIYIILIIVFLPVKWIFSGRWGYSQNFYDNFHAKWSRKIGL